MDLYLKQKVFSWTDKFTVYDRFGEGRYFVEGELFSLGKKLHIFDTFGSETMQIRQKLFSFFPRYYIYRGSHVLAEVVQEWSLFRPRYTVRGPSWVVEGDLWQHDYAITTAEGFTIAAVSREWFTFGDAYAIHIHPDMDEALVLSVVLVIDACLAQKQGGAVFVN